MKLENVSFIAGYKTDDDGNFIVDTNGNPIADPEKGCSAAKEGGAVRANGAVSLDGKIRFEYCSAGTSGGGINASNTVTVKQTGTGNVTFTDCSAGTSSGGIYAGAISAIQGTLFTDCKAVSNGGGLYIAGTNSVQYLVVKQFAEFDDSLMLKDASGNYTAVKLTEAQLKQVFEAFQNPDISSEFNACAGDNVQCIYWDGVRGARKVMLRKVGKPDGDYISLSGAVFTVYKGAGSIVTIKHESAADEVLTGLTSGDNGVFWIGALQYGVYVLEETRFPSEYSSSNHFFYLVVDEDGALVSTDKYETKEAANNAGTIVSSARKEARKPAAAQPQEP